MVQQEQDADGYEAREDDGDDLPLLHFLRRGAREIGYFELRHEVAGYGQRRAEEGGHHEDGDDAGIAVHADLAHEDGRYDHEDGHAGNRLIAREGDGADADDGEQQREEEDDAEGHARLHEALRAVEVEEQREKDDHEEGADDDLRHRDVLLRAKQVVRRGRARGEEVVQGALHDAHDDA